MYLKKQLFLIFIVSVVCSYAMEQPAFQMPKKTIAIRGTDGGIIGISEDIATQISAIKNYFGDSQEIQMLEDEKECLFDGNVIDFMQHPLLKTFSTNEGSSELLDLDSKILKTTFDCISDKENITRLDKEDVLSVFEVAHCLGVSKEFMKQLTYHASDVISEKEFRDNTENPLYAMLYTGHYLTTVRQLFRGKRLVTVIRNAQATNSLCLQSRDIDSLEGIEEVSQLCPSVSRLNLSGNNLRTLNIDLLLVSWPSLQKIKANKIGASEVIWPLSLPYPLYIKLNYNCLSENSFFVPENTNVTLKKNAVKINPIVIIKKPNVAERLRPFVQSFKGLHALGATVVCAGIIALHPNNFFEYNPNYISKTQIAVNGFGLVLSFYLVDWLVVGQNYIYRPGQVVVDQDVDQADDI